MSRMGGVAMAGAPKALHRQRIVRTVYACLGAGIAAVSLLSGRAGAQAPPPVNDLLQVFPVRSALEKAGRDFTASAGSAEFPRAVLSSLGGPADLSRTILAPQIEIGGAPQTLHTRLAEAIGLAAPLTLADVVETTDRLVRMDAATDGVVRIAMIDPAPVDRGIVRIDIGEPLLEMADIAGAPSGVRTYLDAMFSRLRTGGPLTERRIERYLLLFNRVPGCEARFALEAGDSHTGRARLVLHVKFDRGKIRADVSNRFAQGLGREAVYAKVIASDLLVGADVIDFRVRRNIAPGAALILDATYGVNLDPQGLLLEIGAFASSIRPASSRTGGRQFAIEGRFNTLSLTRPLFLTEESQFFLSAGLSSAGFTLSIDDIAVVDEDRWLASAKAEWVYRGFGGLNSTIVSVNRGLDILGATERGASLAARGGEGAAVTIFTLELTRERAWTPWARLVSEAYGQVSTHALQIADQCTFGGRDFGRGFENNSIFGDSCFLAKSELQFRPDFLRTEHLRLEPYLYADVGVLHQVGVADPSQPRDASRMSAAVGTMIKGSLGLSARVEFTQALNRDSIVGDNDERSFFFELGVDF